ncbi:hypothetical protein [Stenotrophomonas sp. YIM B06876]|uniref:hypothetical protein n=1 Tax=Stenotrophomonas sp. YIM B06876 TaxID=3060211 RepID=UPI0027390070|nr:hypothetical protein [Stenotrophomonas sp. YIM B06876]
MRRHPHRLATTTALLALATPFVACKGGGGGGEPAIAASGLPATALQCGKYTACKDDRTCNDGQCTWADSLDAEPKEKGDPYACETGETLLFHCGTTNAKLVTLCDAGSSLRYTFGPMGAGDPEMQLSVPRSDATTSLGVAAQTISTFPMRTRSTACSGEWTA